MLLLAHSTPQVAGATQDPVLKLAEFDAVVERLRRGNDTIGLTRLLILSTEPPGYELNATGNNNRETNSAPGRGDVREALRLALDLPADCLDIDAHTGTWSRGR